MPLQIPDQTIADKGIQPPNPLQTISGMLNIQNQRAQLQGQQIYNQGNQANLDEKTSIRNLVNDPSVQNPDGSLNQDAFAAKAQIAAPTLGAGIAQGNLQNQGTQTANASSAFALHKDYAGTMLQTAAGVMADPRITAGTPSNPNTQYDPEQATNALTEAMSQAEAKGVPKAQALLAVAPFVNAVHTPGAVRQMLANTVQGQLGAGGQAAQNLVPAGGQQSVSTDSNGNPITTSRDQFGNVQGVAGTPVQGQAPTPPNIVPPGESQASMNELRQARTATNTAAAQVPNSHVYNQNVIRLASDPAMMNPNSWAGQGAAYAAKLGLPPGTDYKTALDQISHNLAMSTQANEQAMGVHTDAGAQTTALATGSIGMTPAALASAAKMNDATASGLDAFNRGQEAAISANGGNVSARRAFQNAWSSAYSPTVMALHNAIGSGNKADVTNIINQVGGPGSKGALDLANRAKAIQSLVQTGKLPQGSQ